MKMSVLIYKVEKAQNKGVKKFRLKKGLINFVGQGKSSNFVGLYRESIVPLTATYRVSFTPP